MRFGLIFLVALGPFAGSAYAGDVADLEILGFSADGSVFAFEQHGIQDGSGFPYADRFYIDTAVDKFLPGTPVRVRLESEAVSVEAARSQAREKGEAFLAQAELDANRGTTAGYNPVTELSADRLRMTVNPRPFDPPIDNPIELRLEEIPMPSGACEGVAPAVGFRLLHIDTNKGGAVEVLHQDEAIPQSRGCPTGYRIGAVQTFSRDRLTAYAVLIAVRQQGYEGPDYRWIAVTQRF